MATVGQFLELLGGSERRYSSLRGTIRHWRDRETWSEAVNRASDYRIARADEPPGMPGGEREGGEVEKISRVWFAAGGDLQRSEQDVEGDGHPRRESLIVRPGRWWRAQPGRGVKCVDGTDPPAAFGTYEIRTMLRQVGGLEFRTIEEGQHLGHTCLRAVATPRRSPRWALGKTLPGDEVELVVERERGLMMKVASSLGGRPFEVTEFLEAVFDEELDGELFEPPPNEPPAPEENRRLTIRDAVTQVPFRVLLTPRPPEGAQMETVYIDRRPEREPTLGIHYWMAHGLTLSIRQASRLEQLADPAALEDPSSGWERIEREGRTVHLWEGEQPSGRPTHRWAITEYAGTYVAILSFMERERLLLLATSLTPENLARSDS